VTVISRASLPLLPLRHKKNRLMAGFSISSAPSFSGHIPCHRGGPGKPSDDRNLRVTALELLAKVLILKAEQVRRSSTHA
jgi:hypothetical protein